MTADAQFESWLATATRKLARHSAAQVRAEITEHYQSALASGTTPEAAIAALGDPRSANRKYRRVLLTEEDAHLAAGWAAIDAKARAKAQAGPAPGKFSSRLQRWIAWLSIPALLFNILRPESWAFVPMWMLIFVNHFFPSSSPLRARISLGVSVLTMLWILWPLHQKLWLLFVVLAIPASLSAAMHVRQRGLNRKLAGRDPNSLILGPLPTHTPTFLCCAGPVGTILMLIFAVLSTLFQPLLGGTLLAACAFCLLAPLLVSIDTPERIRLFRQLKWTAIVLAAIAVYFLRSYIPDVPGVEFDAALAFAGIFMLAVIEMGRARFRHKLPVEQWPDWLYFEGPR